jgi:hypothetical protein
MCGVSGREARPTGRSYRSCKSYRPYWPYLVQCRRFPQFPALLYPTASPTPIYWVDLASPRSIVSAVPYGHQAATDQMALYNGLYGRGHRHGCRRGRQR